MTFHSLPCYGSLSLLRSFLRLLCLWAIFFTLLVNGGCQSRQEAPAPVEWHRLKESITPKAILSSPSSVRALPPHPDARRIPPSLTRHSALGSAPTALLPPTRLDPTHPISVAPLPPLSPLKNSPPPVAQDKSEPSDNLLRAKSTSDAFDDRLPPSKLNSRQTNVKKAVSEPLLSALEEPLEANNPSVLKAKKESPPPTALLNNSSQEMLKAETRSLSAKSMEEKAITPPDIPPSVAGSAPSASSAKTSTLIDLGALNFIWPVVGETVVPFGPTSNGLHNDGINIKVRKGTPIRAAEEGVVVFAGEAVEGFGQLLLIKHQNNFTTGYAHTQKILVQKNERVKRGQVVAYSGDSGKVKFPQLHFELRKGLQPIDPSAYLVQQ